MPDGTTNYNKSSIDLNFQKYIRKSVVPNSTYNGFTIDITGITRAEILLSYMGNSNEIYTFNGIFDTTGNGSILNINNRNTSATFTNSDQIKFVCNGGVYSGSLILLPF